MKRAKARLPIIYDNYWIFPDGTVYNIVRMKEVKPTHSVSRSGKRYLKVKLYYKGKFRNHYIQRLVATFYIRPVKKKEQANHDDRNTTNNFYTNIDIMSASKNQKHWREYDRV